MNNLSSDEINMIDNTATCCHPSYVLRFLWLIVDGGCLWRSKSLFFIYTKPAQIFHRYSCHSEWNFSLKISVLKGITQHYIVKIVDLNELLDILCWVELSSCHFDMNFCFSCIKLNSSYTSSSYSIWHSLTMIKNNTKGNVKTILMNVDMCEWCVCVDGWLL